MVTVVADREADIDEMFAGRPGSVEGGAGKLFARLKERPLEEHEVALAARPRQGKRTARLAVRFGSTPLRHPRNRAPEEGVPPRVCLPFTGGF